MLRAVFSHLVWTKVLIESSSKGLGHTQLLLITHHVGSSVSTFLVLNTLKIFFKSIYFIFGCAGSSVLLKLFSGRSEGLLPHCRACHYSGFCCQAWAPACLGLVVTAHGTLEHRLSTCGTWASLLHSMWDLPGPGINLASPALASRFYSSEPPGKPYNQTFN